jgi:elongation factor Ts
MAGISASMVMKLRKMSGQGMMDCKRALQEADGDIDEAMTILRKKGLATLEKRADRETSEGLVICKSSDDGKVITLSALCCETDFVAKNDDFKELAEKMGEYAMACGEDEGADNLLNTQIDGKTFNDVLTEAVSKTGEKTQVGDYARFKLDGPGLIGTYIHFNSKVGAMVQIESSDDSLGDGLKQTAVDIAMHITAIKPIGLDKESIDPAVVEKEKAIFADQVKNKPENIIEKIVEGKLNKYYAENCLTEQAFVKDDSKTVSQFLEESAKAAGGTAKIKRFVRFEVG